VSGWTLSVTGNFGRAPAFAAVAHAKRCDAAASLSVAHSLQTAHHLPTMLSARARDLSWRMKEISVVNYGCDD
jgi:hypothetical protein